MLKYFSITLLSTLLVVSFHSLAIDERTITNSQGKQIYKLRFFDPADGAFADAPNGNMPMPEPAFLQQSGWGSGEVASSSLSAQLKTAVVDAFDYWKDLLQPADNSVVVPINFGTTSAMTIITSGNTLIDYGYGNPTLTGTQAALQGSVLVPGNYSYDALGYMKLGLLPFSTEAYTPSQLPNTARINLTNQVSIGMGQLLGITTQIYSFLGEDAISPIFRGSPSLTLWEKGLHDDDGRPALEALIIVCDVCFSLPGAPSFNLTNDQGYFSGDNVSQVLDGAMRGAPVKLKFPNGSIDTDYLSHPEFNNGLFSHQDYRNYTVPMEAELAVLQDIGYNLDRRNYFGYSVYGSGLTLTNDHGYSARDAESLQYLPGQYNTTLLGLGLHIYGSNNQVTQVADLLTAGNAGAGVRIDGEANTFIVAPGTTIAADGINGLGIMYAYGKGHTLVQRGSVQALGDNGIALNFDFGHNANSDAIEYRGSWIRTQLYEPTTVLDELQGALADQVDISGRVAGSKAAVFISANALVNQINVLNGASLAGDILSQYNQVDANGQPRLTTISFGRLSDQQGRATQAADKQFNFNYSGNIQGSNNLTLDIYGGQTTLTGDHQLYAAIIEPGATLRGGGSYQLNDAAQFVNNGTLAPDTPPAAAQPVYTPLLLQSYRLTSATSSSTLGQISIMGNYRQGPQGSLLLTVDPAGNHDTLQVSGMASLDGALVLNPQPGVYKNVNFSASDMVQAGTKEGNFTSVTLAKTLPTLRLTATQQADDWLLNLSHTFSGYADNDNARRVGNALDVLVNSAGSDLDPLFNALISSAADGSDMAKTLSQLSPEYYSAALAGWLKQQQQITDIVNSRVLLANPSQPQGEVWQAYVQPYGGGYWQQARGSIVGYRAKSYGMVAGIEREHPLVPGLVYGLHGAIGGQSLTLKSPLDSAGHSSGLSIGVNGHYAPAANAGGWFSANSRVGVEQGQLDRQVNLSNLSASSDWSGVSAALSAGTGYRWALADSLSAGPFMQLNYTLLHRNGVTEHGDAAARLKLGGVVINTLRTNVGAESSWQYAFTDGQVLTSALRLGWGHEFLPTWDSQNANF